MAKVPMQKPETAADIPPLDTFEVILQHAMTKDGDRMVLKPEHDIKVRVEAHTVEETSSGVLTFKTVYWHEGLNGPDISIRSFKTWVEFRQIVGEAKDADLASRIIIPTPGTFGSH